MTCGGYTRRSRTPGRRVPGGPAGRVLIPAGDAEQSRSLTQPPHHAAEPETLTEYLYIKTETITILQMK